VDIVRGNVDGDVAERVLRLWSTHGVVDGSAAADRLPILFALLWDGPLLVGTCSVVDTPIEMIGSVRFWLLRGFVADDAGDGGFDVIVDGAWCALDAEHVPGGDGPVGLCLAVDDIKTVRRRREPVWPGSGLRFAGYFADGRQCRVRYFTGAEVVPHPYESRPRQLPSDWRDRYPLPEGYQVHELGRTDVVTADEILDLWMREDVVVGEEAERRVHEVVVVCTGPGGDVAGLASAYLVRNEQLRGDFYALRVYVATPHRRTHVMWHVMMIAKAVLERRFQSGEDTRALGVVVEMENEMLRRSYPQAEIPYTGRWFVRRRRDDTVVSVMFFAGAEVPVP
jgi:hypothetical protein